MLPRISVNEPINPNQNACTARSVFERINPIQINLGRFHSQRQIVSYELQNVQGRYQPGGALSLVIAQTLLHANARKTLWPTSHA